MKKIYRSLLLGAVFTLAAGNAAQAQVDLSIGNIDAGFNYNTSTGVISDIYFSVLSNENGSASNVSLGIYFVPLNASSLSDAYLLGSTRLPSISGNASRDVTGWTVNPNEAGTVPPSGTYRLAVSVDYTDEISETDETNNTLFLSRQGENLEFHSGATGIAELPANMLSFFSAPNPAAAATTVSFALKSSTHGSLAVYDITGTLVAQVLPERTVFAAGENNITVPVDQLSTGIYLLRLQTEQGTAAIRFVKQ